MNEIQPQHEVTCPPRVVNKELNAQGQQTLRRVGGCILEATYSGFLENGVIVKDFGKEHCAQASGCLVGKLLDTAGKTSGAKAA
jgi:hypothetical protein